MNTMMKTVGRVTILAVAISYPARATERKFTARGNSVGLSGIPKQSLSYNHRGSC